MIVSMFQCSWENNGIFYGIFDDIETMRTEYLKIKNNSPNEDEDDIEFDYVVDPCYYKQNRKLEQVFKFWNENFVLIKPIKGEKYDVEDEDKDKMSDKDCLLVFLGRQSQYKLEGVIKYEISCIYLVKNKYAYIECITCIDSEDFSKNNPEIDFLNYSENKYPKRLFQSPPMIGRFEGLAPKQAASLALTKLLKSFK